MSMKDCIDFVHKYKGKKIRRKTWASDHWIQVESVHSKNWFSGKHSSGFPSLNAVYDGTEWELYTGTTTDLGNSQPHQKYDVDDNKYPASMYTLPDENGNKGPYQKDEDEEEIDFEELAKTFDEGKLTDQQIFDGLCKVD